MAEPWPTALPLPPIPAHPRCRCTIRGVFRDQDGNMLPDGTAEVEPKLPSDGMGADKPAFVPPSVGEIEAECTERWQRYNEHVEKITAEMLRFAGGRSLTYEEALNGTIEGGKITIFGPPPPAPVGGALAGLKARQKTLARFIEKVVDMYRLEGATCDAHVASESIGDLIRFTTIFPDATYVADVYARAREMLDAGYRLVKWKDYWPDDDYRGLNTNWVSPDGVYMEMQFHTPESFQIKEINHEDLYNRERVLPPLDPMAAELRQQMAANMETVIRPPGWEGLIEPPPYLATIRIGASPITSLNDWHMQFLQAEELSTGTLMGFYAEARAELEDFIANGSLTASDATFYRQLLDEANRVALTLNVDGESWKSDTIDKAYSTAWRTFSDRVVSQRGLEALSQSTLSLIRDTSDSIRRAIRSQIAQGILQGLTGSAIRARILATGLTNIAHWPSVEYRAGVIARTETMKAFNAGALGSIRATGARYVKWIAAPDEAVCPVCSDRHGRVYLIGAERRIPPAVAAARPEDWYISRPWDQPKSAFMAGDVPGFRYLPSTDVGKLYGLGTIAAQASDDAIYVYDAFFDSPSASRALTLYHEAGHYALRGADIGVDDLLRAYQTEVGGSFTIPWYYGQGIPITGGQTVQPGRIEEVVADVYADLVFGDSSAARAADMDPTRAAVYRTVALKAAEIGLDPTDRFRVRGDGLEPGTGESYFTGR